MRLLLATALLALALPSHAAPRKGAHPDVGGDQNCRECHRGATPASFRAWSEGKHGLALVTCAVCHGSTGADFQRRPASARCEGCHAAQTASLRSPAMKGKDCFTCHPGHPLDPHATSRDATTAGRVNADAELERERKLGAVNGPNAAAEAAGKAPPAPAPAPSAAAPGAAAPGKDLGTAVPHPPVESPGKP